MQDISSETAKTTVIGMEEEPYYTDEHIPGNVKHANFLFKMADDYQKIIEVEGLYPDKCICDISDGYYKIGELYDNTLALLITLCNLYKGISWKCNPDKDNRPSFLKDNEFVVGIITPRGTSSYRIDKRFFDYFKIPEKYKLHSFCDSDVFKLLSLVPDQEKTNDNQNKAYTYSDSKSLALFSRSYNNIIVSDDKSNTLVSEELNNCVEFIQKLIDLINYDFSNCMAAGHPPAFSVKDIFDGYNQIGVLYDLIASEFLVVGKTLAFQSRGKDEAYTKLKTAWKFNGRREREFIPALYNNCFTVGIETDEGVISYPVSKKYWDDFDVIEVQSIPNDDYSRRNNLLRILSLTLSKEEIKQIIDSGLFGLGETIQKKELL